MSQPVDLDRALRPRLPSPLQEVRDERFARHGLRLLLKRDDLIHPELPGNKWRKLAPNLRAAAGRTVLTFGGAYSHHLRATAAAGRLLGFPTIGVVRGDELAARPLNPSLAACAADGMRLHFVDRATYRRVSDPEVLAELLERCGAPEGCRVVPEGGSNALAVRGCTELGRELRGVADVAAVACGTGGTLAGLAAGLAYGLGDGPAAGLGNGPAAGLGHGPAAGLGDGARALGVPVLKGGFLGERTAALQREAFGAKVGDWSLDERFHFGGYARVPPALEAFARDFEARHGLPVERLYVAKMLYGLVALAGEGAFPPETAVAAVITGGPQPEASR
ncbi:pyridoxal-phosphate dependent enzyme [Streptomyces spongiicola]|uniref:1-aminocyclopropane-1-carboxylate deaminase/D-cysteine desulfhydrase n=1 Tax=Streptomyces spongiicola TaxID=1690221 RepID=UPI0033E34BE2